jgi:hypothetical protein
MHPCELQDAPQDHVTSKPGTAYGDLITGDLCR